MNVKYFKKEGFAHKFLVKGTRCDIVNALRRTMSVSIETMAIEKVLIYKNESVMPDEFLAHRLGLIPVEVTHFNDDTKISLYVNKTGGVVRSGDIESNGLAEVTLKNIPIVVLKEEKTLELELVLEKGTGKQHIKWSPAAISYYNLPIITQKEKMPDNFLQKLPKGCAELKANKVVLCDEYNLDLAKYLEVASEGKIDVDLDENNFMFSIEPYGNMSVENIIKKSVLFLESELNELEKEIGKVK